MKRMLEASGASNEPANQQKDNCSQSREGDGAEIESSCVHGTPANARSDESTDERADDAEDDGDDTSRGVASRNEILGQRTGYQTQQNPVKPERHQRPFGMGGRLPVLWNAGAASGCHAIDPEQNERSD